MKRVKPLLWKVRGYRLHVFGSMHFGPDGGYEYPGSVLEAFDSSEVINFEMKELPSSIPRTYTHRRDGSLADDIGAVLFTKLETALPNVADLSSMTLTNAFWTLALSKFDGLGYHGQGSVDRFFLDRARAANKRIYGLETQKAQFDTLFSVPATEALSGIKRYLDDEGAHIHESREVVYAFENGDESLIAGIRARGYQHMPQTTAKVFPEREKRWLPAFDRLRASNRSGFLVAGLVHFAEPDGFLGLLRANGVKTDRVA